jgi:hypothetical protein
MSQSGAKQEITRKVLSQSSNREGRGNPQKYGGTTRRRGQVVCRQQEEASQPGRAAAACSLAGQRRAAGQARAPARPLGRGGQGRGHERTGRGVGDGRTGAAEQRQPPAPGVRGWDDGFLHFRLVRRAVVRPRCYAKAGLRPGPLFSLS